LDTVTPPSETLGPLIFNGYSHTTKEESRLSRTPHYAAKHVIARENLRERSEGAKLYFHKIDQPTSQSDLEGVFITHHPS